MRRAAFSIAASLVLFSFACEAAPLDEYYAARDAYITKFDNVTVTDEITKQEENARNDLTQKLRPVVGPINVQDLPREGVMNLDTLFKGDQGFGTLDALIFSSPKESTSVLVTTVPILQRWLKEHKDWWGANLANVSQEIGAAIKDEAFYTQALKTDAAFFKFVEVPVVKPANTDFVFAMLSGRAQDYGLEKPDELVVTEIRDGKIYIVTVPPVGEIAGFPACNKIWQDAVKKSSVLQEKYSASGMKDEKLLNDGEKAQEEGYAASRRCFAEHAKNEKYFSALIKQAQEWIELMPAK